jgi:hypothetical protein
MAASKRHTPNIGKVFNLKKTQIKVKRTNKPDPKDGRVSSYISWSCYNIEGYSILNNKNGDICGLVTNEWAHTVEILYQNYRYVISKGNLLSPLNDLDEQETKDCVDAQLLVNEYFILLNENNNLPESFVKFGKKLKKFQENLETKNEKN